MHLTYGELMGSRHEPMPAGYNHLRYRGFIGAGAEVFARASAALMRFDMHRAAGLRIVETSVERDAVVRQGLWFIDAPIRIVWASTAPDQAGFGIGTLPGHPETGEESFVLTFVDGKVWLEIRSFSLPARWYTRLAGPLVPVLQRAFARRCGRVLRRIVRSG